MQFRYKSQEEMAARNRNAVGIAEIKQKLFLGQKKFCCYDEKARPVFFFRNRPRCSNYTLHGCRVFIVIFD